MIHVLEPQNELLKQFVDSMYVFKKGSGSLEFTAYPSTNTPVALLRNAAMNVTDGHVYITHSDTPNHFAMVCNQFSGSLHLQYQQLVDEIAINFKPLGFASFTRSRPEDGQLCRFGDWDPLLPALFHQVFEAEDQEEQLYHIEQLLLSQYVPLTAEATLLRALELLNDTSNDYKMQEIARRAGLHYKQLYRHFTENVGCSPVHYRKLIKFRASVVSKMQKGDNVRLVDICYDHDYTDQPYFIKQFKALTGEKPTRFFKEVTSFGNDKVIFKMEEPFVQ